LTTQKKRPVGRPRKIQPGAVSAPVGPDLTRPETFDMGAIIRELVDRGGYLEFVRQFWQSIEPAEFQENWHHGAMCEYLERVALGDCKRLVINIPPSSSKSTIVSVLWPAWMWALKPETRFLVASFDQSLVLRDAGKMISCITSETYQGAYPYVELSSPNPAHGNFTNTSGGLRFSTTPEGKGTGRHAHVAIIDDPMKPQDTVGNRAAAFAKVNNWFDYTLPTRAVVPKEFAIVVIMQRLHHDDIAGRCKEMGYESLILPMRQVKRTMWARDPRKEPGELLWPSRYDEDKVRELELSLRNEASAQLQQDPTPATGGFIHEAWTRLEWIEPPVRGTFCQSWDFSSKGIEEAHSKVSGQLWCVTRDLKFLHEYLSSLDDRLAKIPGAATERILRTLPERTELYCLLDWVGGHWDFPASKREFTMAQSRPMWDRAKIKLIELKANGPAIISEMKNHFPGIKGVEPEGSKEERLHTHTEKWEMGQVVYPPGRRKVGKTEYAVGADVVREEHVKFPRFTWDDMVDTTTQALDRLANNAKRYRENLRLIAQRG
jgi:hypothetical protein